jgi:hypothetical protein
MIDVPDEIVMHLQSRNRKHFGQADGTPFTTDALLHDLGFCGDGPGTDDILEGQYQQRSLSMHVQLLLQHLKLSHEMAQLRSFPTITQNRIRRQAKCLAGVYNDMAIGYALGSLQIALSSAQIL